MNNARDALKGEDGLQMTTRAGDAPRIATLFTSRVRRGQTSGVHAQAFI